MDKQSFQFSDHGIFLSPISIDRLLQSLRQIIREEITAERSKEELEKLLSPAETCKMFSPPISKPTLAAWTRKGFLQDYRINGRVFYKMTEILSSLKTLKRYKNK